MVAKKDPFDDQKRPNLKVLRAIRLQGEHVPVGAVFPKSEMPKPEWKNLVHMERPRLEETDEEVGLPAKATRKTTAALPGT